MESVIIPDNIVDQIFANLQLSLGNDGTICAYLLDTDGNVAKKKDLTNDCIAATATFLATHPKGNHMLIRSLTPGTKNIVICASELES